MTDSTCQAETQEAQTYLNKHYNYDATINLAYVLSQPLIHRTLLTMEKVSLQYLLNKLVSLNAQKGKIWAQQIKNIKVSKVKKFL